MKFLLLFTLAVTSFTVFADDAAKPEPPKETKEEPKPAPVKDGSDFLARGKLVEGRKCYSECKSKKSFLGLVGKEKEGLERKSCLPCLLEYKQLYTVKPEFIPEDKGIKVPEMNGGVIYKGEVCHDECKPRKDFIVAGKTKEGADRRSCIDCLGKYQDLYKLNPEFEEAVGNKYFVCKEEAGDHVFVDGDACFAQCKPKKGFLLVGKEKSCAERAGCKACIEKHPTVYKKPEVPNPAAGIVVTGNLFGVGNGALGGSNCDVSADLMTATCGGLIYRRDFGVNFADRFMNYKLDLPAAPVEQPAPTGRAIMPQ